MLSPCDGCHSGCCRSFAVPITGADVIRIEQQSGLDFWSFACRWADPEGLIARNYAPHLHFDDEPDTPFTLCLLHTSSISHPGTSKCVFLDEDVPTAERPLGEARCGKYHERPMACRVFPTKLDPTGEMALIQPIPERPREGSHPAYSLCPREWTPDDIDPVQSIQDLIVTQHEMEFFRRLAHAWNKKPGPWRLFPEFLRMVYAGRVKSAVPEQKQRRSEDERAA